jgi:chemotaxis response regulator CheB
MPREAVLLGAAQRILPLNEIGSNLMSMVGA